MKCNNCKNDNLDGAKICAFCDQPLETAKTKQEVVNEKIDIVLNYDIDDKMANKKIFFSQPDDEDDEYEYYDESEEHVSIGGWMGIICLNLIPILGTIIYVILLCIWAFGGTQKVSLKNFAKASLIIFAILALLSVALYFALNALGINVVQIVAEVAQDFIK